MANKIVTVVITVKNRLKLTKQTFETLAATMPDYGKLTVVADNPDQDVLDYIVTIKADRGIRMFVNTGHWNCNNAAASVVDTEYVYFSDNDMYFTNGWLDKLLDIYSRDKKMGIVGGMTSAHHLLVKDKWDYQLTSYQCGYSMLIKMDVWKKIGPFTHTDPGDYEGKGDTTLSINCWNQGFYIGQPKPQVIYHCGITSSDGGNSQGYYFDKLQDFPVGCYYE